MQPEFVKKDRGWRYTVGTVLVLTVAALGWSYWTVFVDLAEEWAKNPLYSHGYLVPIFAAVLLWTRRDRIPQLPLQPSWWALAFLITGSLLRLGGAYFYFSWPDRGSILFMLFAAALAIGGWAAVRWSWPAILFLAFMIPFPGFVEDIVTRPLQRVATIASTNVLQTLGFFAQADGNVIVLSEVEMGIVEACSGLRMLSTFIALTVGACLLSNRSLPQKAVICLSSIPIAVICNVARISATGVLYEVADHDFATFVFHDLAGYLMPVMALLLLLAELKLLDFVFVSETIPDKSVAPHGPGAKAPPPAKQVLSPI